MHNPHLIDPKSQLTNAIEIPQKRHVTVLLLLGSIAFVILCVFLFINAADMTMKGVPVGPLEAIAVRITMAVGALFFGACSIGYFKKILDRTPAIIISDEGIVDNSTGVNIGFVPWSEVTSIEKLEVKSGYGGINTSSYFVSLKVRDPENLTRKSGPITKLLTKINSSFYNSDISISPQFTGFSVDELKDIIEERHAKATKSRQV